MKHSIIILAFVAFFSSLYAAEDSKEEPPIFKTVAEFLNWADSKLSVNDYSSMIIAQTASKVSNETQLAYIKKLDADLGEAKLSKIFAGRRFPANEKTFKLGGHLKELGHCHIDFNKIDGSWRLARIWHCR